MHRLLRNIGWLLTGRGLNALLSLVYLALATRTLGLDNFGYFAIILALGQTVTGIANFQTWQFVVRWGADGDGPADATGFAIALDLLSIALGLVLAAVLVGTAPLWLPLPDELLPVAFGYCVVSLLAIRTTPTGLLRLRFAYARTTAAEAVQPVVRAAGAAAAAIAMPTVTGFILAWAAAEVAVAAALWIAAGRLERINLSGGYRVASQLGQALVSLAQTVSKAIYPELVHAKETAHAMARRMANIALIAGVLAVLGTLFLGRPALALIAGPEFRVFWTMVILAIAGAIELVGASLESLLVSAGRAGTAFLIRAIPTVIGLSLLEVAMGWNGLKGAAFTVMGASALSVLGFWVAIISLSQITITVKPKPEVPPER